MISDSPLVVCFRNFYRNKMVNLSATSVRHFLPKAKIYCLTLYKYDMCEYDKQEKLHNYIEEFTAQTKYVSTNDNHDDVDPTKTSGFANPLNGSYFCEGYNLIFDEFKDLDKPLLMLSEDHFFTQGTTLLETVTSDWDVLYADGDSPDASRANGSILGIVPTKVTHLFPLPETMGVQVEWMIAGNLLRYIEPDRLHRLTTRNWIDYCGDGLYTNASSVIEDELRKVGIIS